MMAPQHCSGHPLILHPITSSKKSHLLQIPTLKYLSHCLGGDWLDLLHSGRNVLCVTNGFGPKLRSWTLFILPSSRLSYILLSVMYVCLPGSIWKKDDLAFKKPFISFKEEKAQWTMSACFPFQWTNHRISSMKRGRRTSLNINIWDAQIREQ